MAIPWAGENGENEAYHEEQPAHVQGSKDYWRGHDDAIKGLFDADLSEVACGSAYHRGFQWGRSMLGSGRP